jgi:hypothetical protein
MGGAFSDGRSAALAAPGNASSVSREVEIRLDLAYPVATHSH